MNNRRPPKWEDVIVGAALVAGLVVLIFTCVVLFADMAINHPEGYDTVDLLLMM